MYKILVEGGRRLEGEVTVSGAKNAALPILISSLLAEGKNTYTNVPMLRDIDSVKELLTALGASVETDGHTVGIDAIMNMKGYNMDYGLERYPEIEAINLGAQVPCETLLKESIKQNVDAILVSQTVTQKDSHINNFTEFIELLEVENIRSKFIVLAGGPRISNDLAIELGYDAGFGSGTIPSTVASFIVTKLIDLKES